MPKATPSKIFLIALLIVSAVGFLDATYLTAKHFLDDPVTCSILEGCETVTTSKYSIFLGMPIALGGAIYYLAVSILLFLFIEGEAYLLRPLLVITGVGFLVTLYLVYLQAYVLDAFCLYCLLSAVTSTTLFIGGIYLVKRSNPVGRSG